MPICDRDIPGTINLATQLHRQIQEAIEDVESKFEPKLSSTLASIEKAMENMEESTCLADLDFANVQCQMNIKEAENMVDEMAALVSHIDPGSYSRFAAIAMHNDPEQDRARLMTVQQLRNHFEVKVARLEYKLAIRKSTILCHRNKAAVQLLLFRGRLEGAFGPGEAPDDHEERVARIEEEDVYTQAGAYEVLLRVGARLGIPIV